MQMRELLFNLSTPASACQHLPAALYQIVDAVLASGALDLSAAPMHAFVEQAPALYNLLRRYESPLPEEVLQLLQQLRAASAAAWPAGALLPQRKKRHLHGVAGWQCQHPVCKQRRGMRRRAWRMPCWSTATVRQVSATQQLSCAMLLCPSADRFVWPYALQAWAFTTQASGLAACSSSSGRCRSTMPMSAMPLRLSGAQSSPTGLARWCLVRASCSSPAATLIAC